MKLELTQEKLSKALSIVSRIASSKSGLPILNNILLRTDGSKLVVLSTNLEIAIVEYLNVKIIKPGSITIPAKLLNEFISNLPKTTVVLEAKNGHLHVSAGNYKSTINGIDSDEFPELPILDEKTATTFEIDVDSFKESVPQVVVAASGDTTRPALTGVFLNTNNKTLCLAATDGYRLAEKKLIEKAGYELSAIVPAASLQEVIRSIGDDTSKIEVLFDDNQIRFRFDDIEITSKIIDARFPDYRQLIPKHTDVNVVINKEELLRVSKLAALFARESGGSIIIEAISKDNTVSIKSVASELGENDSSLDAKVDGDGKVTLNSRFLIDALNNIPDEDIHFGFSGKLAPVVIKSNASGYTHIIMPLKS